MLDAIGKLWTCYLIPFAMQSRASKSKSFDYRSIGIALLSTRKKNQFKFQSAIGNVSQELSVDDRLLRGDRER